MHVSDAVGMTTGTPASPSQSLKYGASGQQRATAVKLPAYLHKTARPGAAPNTKVAYVTTVMDYVGFR